MKLYEGGKKYESKANLWEPTKTTLLEIEPAKVKQEKKLTKSVAVIEKKCHYIEM